MNAYTLTTTHTSHAQDLIPSYTFNQFSSFTLPNSSIYDIPLPLQDDLSSWETHNPVIENSYEDEEQFFDFSTVNKSLQPQGIIIQPAKQEQNQQRLRKILEDPMINDSHHMPINGPHDKSTSISYPLSLVQDRDNNTRDKEISNSHQENTRHLTTTGIPSFNDNSTRDSAFTVAPMLFTESYHTATRPANPAFNQSGNITEKLQYKNPTILSNNPRTRSPPESYSTMPHDLHPHSPIPLPDVDQQHPVSGLPLIPATMSLNSNSAVIAKIRQDQNIDDQYFADCIFPDATLTVFQNGTLCNVRGRASCCFHFDQNDPCMFHVSGTYHLYETALASASTAM